MSDTAIRKPRQSGDTTRCARRQEQISVRWREGYRSPIASARIRNVPVECISDVISNLLYGTMFTNYFTDQRHSVEAQARYILDIAFNGILSDSERPCRGEWDETVDLTERTGAECVSPSSVDSGACALRSGSV